MAPSEKPAAETAATAPEKQGGFESVTLYNHAGDARLVETVADRVAAEFDGYRLTTKPRAK